MYKLKDEVSIRRASGYILKDETLKLGQQLCVSDIDDLRELIIREMHYAHYHIHPGTTKMYHDIKGYYWWLGMKRDVAQFVSTCLACQQVKFEYQKPSGLLEEIELPI